MKRHPRYDEIKKLLQQGLPVIAICHQLHVDQRPIRKIRDEIGIPVFRGHRLCATCRSGHTYPPNCRTNSNGHRICPQCAEVLREKQRRQRARVDELAVEFAAAGRAPAHLRHVERIEILKRLNARPEPLDTDEVARRLACTTRTVWRIRRAVREQEAVAA